VITRQRKIACVMCRVLSLVMQELLQTENDYIRALNYVIDNYIPEILCENVPQPLRGKKNVLFGNLQNICKFHSEAFLREIEACVQSPFQLGACFLRHVIHSCCHSLVVIPTVCNYYLIKSLDRKEKRHCAPDATRKHMHKATMTSFAVSLCNQCCRLHVVGQQVVSESVVRNC